MNRSAIVRHPVGASRAREASGLSSFTGMARSHKGHGNSPAAPQTAFAPVGAGHAREASESPLFTGMARSHKDHGISPTAPQIAFAPVGAGHAREAFHWGRACLQS